MSGDVRERLAAVLHEGEGTCSACLADAAALLPTVDALIREGAAKALEQAADDLDTRAVELWRVYKSGPPTDPRRANTHTEGESDGWENAGTAVRARAAALRAASHTEATR